VEGRKPARVCHDSDKNQFTSVFAADDETHKYRKSLKFRHFMADPIAGFVTSIMH